MNKLTTLILCSLIMIAAIVTIHKKRTMTGLFLSLLLIVLSNTLSFMNLIVKPIDKTEDSN